MQYGSMYFPLGPGCIVMLTQEASVLIEFPLSNRRGVGGEAAAFVFTKGLSLHHDH